MALPKPLSFADFARRISGKGATFVSFTAEVDPRLKKTGNPFGEVIKRSAVNGVVNYVYENAVLRQQEREGVETPSFNLEKRAWGVRRNLAIVDHKGEMYLTVKVERVLTAPVYYSKTLNRTLTLAEVEPFLPKKSSNAEHQGVEREVIHREYAFASIRNLQFGGTLYELHPD